MAYQLNPGDAGQGNSSGSSQARPSIPEYLGRKGEGKMSKDELASVVQQALQQSVQFIDTELSVERARATEYYLGKPFGNEEDGRSQAILTELRDAVDGMVPSLLRVFFGPEHTVEFTPKRADQVEQAAQMTDYIRYVFEEDNKGFLRTTAVLKDGLVRKIGIFKWGWDTSRETRAYRMEGIDDTQLKQLAANDDVTLVSVVKRDDEMNDVELTRTIKGGRPRAWEIPPEEFVFNRQARSIDEAMVVAHRTDKTRGQLIAMGVKEKDLDEHAGPGNTTDVTLRGNAEEIARRDIAGVGRVTGFGYTSDPEMGPANDKILYTEAWMTVDYDGDGIAELRRICCIGPSYYPVENTPADEAPFAIFTPYPEPHALLGGSVADRTMDVQKINSSLLRGMLDSLSASIFPRTVYQEGMVSVGDIMNTAIGQPIRSRGDVNTSLRTLDVDFTGKEVLPVLAFMQDVIERRTGRNKGAAGLDADALQSTDKGAVDAVLSGSQEQLEMIARIFAEMTLKPLFKGLLRLVVLHEPRPRVVRLRGQWTEVRPDAWDADMDVTVNVALGKTFVDKKVATLMAVAADQKEIAAATGGLSSPVVPIQKILATRKKIMELQGIKDFENYYTPLPPNWQPPQPPPPPPDPAVVAIQAEHQMNQLKVVKELTIKQDELALKREDADRDFQFQVKKHADDVELRKYAIDAQFHSTMTQTVFDAQTEREVKETELTLQAHDQLHDQALERDQQSHEQDIAQQAQDTAAQAAQQPDAPSDSPSDAGGGE